MDNTASQYHRTVAPQLGDECRLAPLVEELPAYPISTLVNSPKNASPLIWFAPRSW
jgi:hypothetical protein